ncbi:MAG: methyltransferase domain-containing protein [Chloroflexota bacterium]
MSDPTAALLPILSHYQANPLLEAKQNGYQSALVSFDLGKSTQTVSLTLDGVRLGDDASSTQITWDELIEVVENQNACYQVFEGGFLEKVQFFSEEMQRAYSLFPTPSAPTMLVSGITMHRIVDCDPWEDTKNKIKAFGGYPVGEVLDTTMGLGYTAIMAAQGGSHVTTIEIDPTVVSVCEANPWSRELFTRPNIKRVIGHAWDVIEELPDASFSAVIHDPPMFNMAGELYSLDFYRELYRVLKSRGRLFHYVGNPKSRSGASVTKGVLKRLKEAGFRRVSGRERAFGLLASK